MGLRAGFRVWGLGMKIPEAQNHSTGAFMVTKSLGTCCNLQLALRYPV